jgi:hypothetical protein
MGEGPWVVMARPWLSPMAADLILTPAGNCTASGLPDSGLDDGRPKLPLMRGCHNQLSVPPPTAHEKRWLFRGAILKGNAEGVEHALSVEQQCDGPAAPQIDDERLRAVVGTNGRHLRGFVQTIIYVHIAQAAIVPVAWHLIG